GRVVDPLGRPLDNAGALLAEAERSLSARPPRIAMRSSLSRPLITGIKAVDILYGLRCGVSTAFIGPSGAGKTDLLLTTAIAQKWSGHRCFFCAVGVEPTQLAQLVETLRRAGSLSNTTVIAAWSSAPPAMKLLAPSTALAMAEHERALGRHAV